MKNVEAEMINFFETNMVNYVVGSVNDTFSDAFPEQLKKSVFSGNSEELRSCIAPNKMMPDSTRAPQV
jgi:hypothetical protein